MSKLALLGGEPVFSSPVARYSSIGEAEFAAVADVIRSGCLSGFYGSWEEGFLGGPKVQEFEAAWSALFGAEYTVSVNSNTSGLYAAMGAVGVSPGDEVIVPATTMSATAVAPLIYGGIPVFADIEPNTFCIDLESVEANLTEKTRAIIAVNLFGHPARLHELRALCDERDIFLIEDNAQAVLAMERARYCGTIGHIGVFSLNYHKHIHTGEGGMCTTDDYRLAERLRMIRNHAEAVAEPAGATDLTNLVGFNFRMTEMSAAIGLVQLAAIDRHIGLRLGFAHALSEGLAGLDGLVLPVKRADCTHSYYNWMLRYDASRTGISRAVFLAALKAEGVPCFGGYVRPLYHLPLFQARMAIGRAGFPFSLSECRYEPGLCPVAERLYEKEFLGLECCAWQIDEVLVSRIVEAVRKVHASCVELAQYEHYVDRDHRISVSRVV